MYMVLAQPGYLASIANDEHEEMNLGGRQRVPMNNIPPLGFFMLSGPNQIKKARRKRISKEVLKHSSRFLFIASSSKTFDMVLKLGYGI